MASLILGSCVAEKSIEDHEFAIFLDSNDPLSNLRKDFLIPKFANIVEESSELNSETLNQESVYLCGNSLGLQPKLTKDLLLEELDVWGKSGVNGHFLHEHNRPWVSVDANVIPELSKIVGAKEPEVIVMNSLTANLHFLMVSFYTPTKNRHKILIEGKAFPSDYYAIESQLKFHGFDSSSIIEVSPTLGKDVLSKADILKAIEIHGDEVALILFSGVQYYTGQFFPMKEIVEAGHAKGCIVGFDLAHAVGNVELQLHDWNVDFACWCSYKYLNSGPGAIGGAFVHEKHLSNFTRPRFAGWWGTNSSTRFQMSHKFDPPAAADAFRLSNPCVFSVTALHSSLKVFSKTSMSELTERSKRLTGYCELLLTKLASKLSEKNLNSFTIVTPGEGERGCQLSLKFLFEKKPGSVSIISNKLRNLGIVIDEREPEVVRVSPVPLYNSFEDIWKFVRGLEKVLTNE
ncbi:hypothetical protein HK096_008000 [Nowakowskiella sp. JEL0078]|nr:hypothetical protein HK096_008000 [Nowakowskiella sp. JEL0078]